MTSYVTWKGTKGCYQLFDKRIFVFARYFRLTPGLLFSVCGVLLLPLTGSGPLFNDIILPITNGCKRNWWVNLLYLQNLIHPEHIVSYCDEVAIEIDCVSSGFSAICQVGGFPTICKCISCHFRSSFGYSKRLPSVWH